MSTYGRLWEERKTLRSQLCRLGVGIGEYATLDEATMAAALVTVADSCPPARGNEITHVLNRWREIEKVMEACDSGTGEP